MERGKRMRENVWEKCEYDSSKLFELDDTGLAPKLRATRMAECGILQETGKYYLYLVWGIDTRIKWKVVYEKVEDDDITDIVMAAIHEGKIYLLQIRTSTDGVRDAFAYARFEFLTGAYSITCKDNPIQVLQDRLRAGIMEFETPDELNDWYEKHVHLCSGERYTEIFGDLFSKTYRDGEWVYRHWPGG